MEQKDEAALFSVKRRHAGADCSAYFFARWSGYSHPVKPEDPISIQSALGGAGYCTAVYCPSPDGPLLVSFRGVGLDREVVELSRAIPRTANDAPRYFRPDRNGESLEAGSEVSPGEAIDLKEFLLVWGPGPELGRIRTELVRVSAWYAYDYTYDGKGQLTKAVIANERRSNVLNFKPPSR